ncbi:guanylate cyclase 32E-like isoform X2 [Daphnia carinata]|uniref:guanylate cyclase 32E-like isoform X2 n=1 Tax=Daphnia carinata TaxID=120202 RepID=UPI0028685147|nr:guanylate cyclase 32E-like isoform X2 [Daphnia carinata]
MVPLTIGFLSSYLSSKMTLGAIPLAVEAVNKDPNLLPGRKLKFVAADIGNPVGNDGLTALAIRRMTEMRDNNLTIAFIGPDGHHCADEALVAAAWNLPIITHKCSEKRVSDMPQTYFTFSRTIPPASKISKPVIALLQNFGWNRILIIVGKKNEWIQIKDAVQVSARDKRIEVIDVIYLDDHSPTQMDAIKTIAESTFLRTRIYLFIGQDIALIHFVKALHGLGVLATGDYMIISIDDSAFDPETNAQNTNRNRLNSYLTSVKTQDEIQAFRSVLKVTSSHPRNPNARKMLAKMKEYSSRPPFCVPNRPTIFDDIEVPIDAYHAYDAVLLYAQALTESLGDGYDPRNGTNIVERIRSRVYHSVLGYDVFIDSNGDAEGNYTVFSMLPFQRKRFAGPTSYDVSNYVMQPVGYFQYNTGSSSPKDFPVFLYFNSSRPIDWIGFGPPVPESPCGFTREMCVRLATPDWRSVVCTVSGVVFIVTIGLASRHYCYAHKLACLLWKVDTREIIITASPADITDMPDHYVARSLTGHHHGRNTNNSPGEDKGSPGKDDSSTIDQGMKRFYTRTGSYKGNVVAIKTIHAKSLSFTNNIRKELKQMSALRHENVASFMGVSVENGSISILTAYCARGSLEDILKYLDFKLDTFFIASLVTDLIKGMIFLHESEIVSHGNLKSSNCLVDSRWVLQITDFGLHEIKATSNEAQKKAKCAKRLLWKAPELFRNPNPPPRGTQKGDVYSFGIILYEIFGRKGPWGDLLDTMSPTDIVERLTHPERFSYKFFRPPVSLLNCKEYIIRCMQDCWHETPEMRPNFKSIRSRLKEMEAGLKPNIFDNIMIMMEKYTYNLEGLVQERTDQLVEEKKKTEALLHRVLPKSVVESLKRGEPVKAESFDSVTIYFSDIVGFTSLSAVSTPLQVVGLLNELYTLFDSILENYDAYKVETIGDAYMVASGLPIRNRDYHAAEIASLALHLLSEIRNFRIRHRPGETLKLRIGIHSGPCVAGVVGLKMPRYCLFGDTVNTASRMESTGQALRIHISAATKELLDRLGGFVIEERGLTSIRGKGEMMTYWLAGEESWRAGRRRPSTLKREIAATAQPTDADQQIGLQCPTMLGDVPCVSKIDHSDSSIINIRQKINNDVHISVDSGTNNSFSNLWLG